MPLLLARIYLRACMRSGAELATNTSFKKTWNSIGVQVGLEPGALLKAEVHRGRQPQNCSQLLDVGAVARNLQWDSMPLQGAGQEEQGLVFGGLMGSRTWAQT